MRPVFANDLRPASIFAGSCRALRVGDEKLNHVRPQKRSAKAFKNPEKRPSRKTSASRLGAWISNTAANCRSPMWLRVQGFRASLGHAWNWSNSSQSSQKRFVNERLLPAAPTDEVEDCKQQPLGLEMPRFAFCAFAFSLLYGFTGLKGLKGVFCEPCVQYQGKVLTSVLGCAGLQ